MAWTWNEVLSLALVRSGILGRGQIATAPQMDEAKKMAALLLDEWDGLGLALPVISSSITFNTVAGQASYTLGPSGDYAVRPESILTATLTIATGPVVKVTLRKQSYEAYTLIQIPSTQSQPFYWALNPAWPQAVLYLYPAPDRVYPVILNAKIKWSDTITTPDTNVFATAEVPSGYSNAFVENLALKLAKRNRLETQTLIDDANSTRYSLASQMIQQYKRPKGDGMGVFSDVVIRAGVNP